MLLFVSVTFRPRRNSFGNSSRISVRERFIFSRYRCVYYDSKDIHTLVLYTLNMETCRTFLNVLENFQKKRKNFVVNLIEIRISSKKR